MTRPTFHANLIVLSLVLVVSGVACAGPLVTSAPSGASDTAAPSSLFPDASARLLPSSSPLDAATALPTFPSTPAPSLFPPSGGDPTNAHFPGGLLIADRLNGRLLVVDDAGAILWRFPLVESLPAGQTFSADDAFVTADGSSIVANEESNQVIVKIDIATEKVVWQYGSYGVHGAASNQLSTPDDAYPLANGDITVADIKNCRILQIAPSSQIVRQWGTAGVCTDNPPTSFGRPNGDTPLPDGGMLITEIDGSRVVRLSSSGQVVFDISVPVKYPSDAHLMANGDVLVVDYANPGAVVVIDPQTGATVYRYGPSSGDGQLNHPSLAVPLPDGTFAVNDDYNHRVVVIDPQTNSIVWSYGHLGMASAADGFLNLPDGIDPVPVGIFQ